MGPYRLRCRFAGRVAVESSCDRQGGRERPLLEAQAIAPGEPVFCAPGNAGTALDVQNVSIEPSDFRSLIQFARRGSVTSVVSPEEPLTNGIVDTFQREGLRIFGPRRMRPSWKEARSSPRS
ncbi:MAG: phosphoribosylamine--glycine ligase N-terminal domain-containing protein [Isosphaeraceae bacterium]